MRVKIYRDYGVGLDSYRAAFDFAQSEFQGPISSIDAKSLKKSDALNDCDLLIFPGGRDIPFDRALKGIANQNIKQFVYDGGIYLGICAGAYYAASQIEFELGTNNEVQEGRDLGFFKGVAAGSLEQGTFCYKSRKCANIVPVKAFESEYNLFYYGGCYFKDADQFEQVEVIARYSHNSLPAIIKCQYGKGFALLSGVHFEMGDQHIHDEGLLKEKLTVREEKRLCFLKQLVGLFS